MNQKSCFNFDSTITLDIVVFVRSSSDEANRSLRTDVFVRDHASVADRFEVFSLTRDSNVAQRDRHENQRRSVESHDERSTNSAFRELDERERRDRSKMSSEISEAIATRETVVVQTRHQSESSRNALAKFESNRRAEQRISHDRHENRKILSEKSIV